MFDQKQRPSAPVSPDPSSTVSYGTGAAAGAPAGQRVVSQPPPPQGQVPAAKATLSPRTIELVQRTWAQVVPISDAAATLFYDRLFEMDPSVRPLFKNDTAQQKKKLMQTLSVAVDGLNNLTRLIPVLEQLGARHAGYMVQDHHYDLVGETLLWTLREGLGDGFTPETETAWKAVYGVVSSVMKKAAATATPSKPPASAPEAPAEPPPVPEEFDVQVASPMLAAERKATGDDTLPYHMLVQAPMGGMEPFSPTAPRGEALADAPRGAPAAAPYSSAISIPVNVPREVTFNVNLHLKLDAESALRALESRAPAPTPAPAPAPAPRAAPTREPPAPELSAPQRAPTSPALLVALCVLVSISTVIALGPLGQATASLALQDLARFAVPVFTVAALAVGYLWGRGRSPERRA